MISNFISGCDERQFGSLEGTQGMHQSYRACKYAYENVAFICNCSFIDKFVINAKEPAIYKYM